MPDTNLTMREELHAALSQRAAAQNVTGQVTTFSLGFPAEFDDDPPLDPVPMYEVPGAELQRLLSTDAAAQAGLPPDDGNQLAGIRYAAARLKYLLDHRQVRTSGWSQPPDAAEALGEAATQLRQMQMRTGDLQRTMRAAVAATVDGPTLRAQYLVRCSPNGFPGAYHVRVFAPPRGRHVVIIGELADNHSTHLTTASRPSPGRWPSTS